MERVSFTDRGGSKFLDTSVFSYIPRYTVSRSIRNAPFTPHVAGVLVELYLIQISAESSRTDVTVFVVLRSVRFGSPHCC
jgi:hypothetical protein